MTGTTVKNAPAILANVQLNAGKNANSAAAPAGVDFQSVWNNQMGKNAQNAANTQTAMVTPKNSGQPAADRGNVRPEEPQKTVESPETPTDSGQSAKADKASQKQPEQTDELSPEEMEEVMEALGTAAVKLMQEIAYTFGISMEELQGTLDELGLDSLDLLQPAGLGELILKLGGAEDSFALLTDEALCGNYKAIMEQMDAVMNETAENFGIDMKQLEALLNGRQAPADEKAVSENTASAETVPADKALSEAAPVEMVSDVKASDEKNLDRQKGLETQEDGAARTLDSLAEDRLRADSAVGESGDAAEDKRNSGKQSGKETEGGQQENPFAQEFKPLQPETGLQQTQSAAQSTSWNADTQDIMRQIMDYMKLQLNADTTNLEMHLHPASLGTLHIQVEAKAGVITASFITQNEAVKAALESQIVQLRENFEEQGIKVEAIEVTVQSHAFERNLDQGREQNQGSNEPSRRTRVRRINLNDLSAVEDMDEEDALAADMLAAGGSTVDYTA